MSLMASNSNIASANRSAVAMWQLPLPVISARPGRTSALGSRTSVFSLMWPPWFRMRHLLPCGRWWKLQHPTLWRLSLAPLSARDVRLTWAWAVSRCSYSRFSISANSYIWWSLDLSIFWLSNSDKAPGPSFQQTEWWGSQGYQYQVSRRWVSCVQQKVRLN